MITSVTITKSALKQLRHVPNYLQQKFRAWLTAIHKAGLEEVRKSKGWHDEPLQGKRKGERSVRLNKKWRVIYVIKKDNTIECIEVTEVTAHDYRCN